ncbi:glycosyltransferase family 4 protein [Jatrophihabitans sp. YIM 134969]
MTSRVLLVTNDFPPRRGGIQSFLHELAVRLPADKLAVYCSDHPGSAAFDAAQPFPVVRASTSMLLPTPCRTAEAAEQARRFGADTVWFGAAAPLGLMGPALRERAGVTRVVATTHGHETGWALLPGARGLLRRIGRSSDVVTYISGYTGDRLASVFRDAELERLAPGVDVDTFRPDVDGAAVRRRWGLGDDPTVVCVSRLVPRKGQDVLVDVWPRVREAVPDARLLLVGGGRYEASLRRRAGAGVAFTGLVDAADLPAHYAAGDVFAMPCRTRRAGLDVEGLGIVFLEGSATGLPVVVGDSGGAPDAVRDGETGLLVDGRDHDAVAAAVVVLLRDGVARQRMGAAGRAWVTADWTYDASAARLAELLRL